jgi:serine/threonine protein kinase/tetratricopeptide (TPR) repeat protein
MNSRCRCSTHGNEPRDRHERTIFINALEKEDPVEREAYLDEACAGNAPMRQGIERLLKAHEPAASFLEHPAPGLGATIDEPTITERPGCTIGPYKLMEQIGVGGMGLVFVAEQQQPVRRKVALKVIKPGMDSRRIIARFEAERQALALMDHPNIARVLDAGTTDSGRPFFVMELVHGVPITRFCDERCLTPRERLELFVPVCQAIQHAHQKGIIHRDIKPSNVLVTLHDGKPVPKVIDFGLAKAIGQQLTDKTIYTAFAHMVGTPLYMSPEQAEMSGLDIDTRSDIYSLGVLLYELLTGATPFDRDRLHKAAFDEVRRFLKEEEPPRSSMRISTSESLVSVSAQRRTEPAKLSRLVRGELDWIVMKALDKDCGRRYETANGFARDVQRYLADEPVEVCPPSAGYRLRKFARKHRTALVFSTCAVFSLLLVVVLSLWAAMRLRAAHAQAERQRQEVENQRDRTERGSAEARKSAAAAKRVSDFVLHDLLVSLAPHGSPRRTIQAEHVLNRASAALGKVFAREPEMEATARESLSWAYRNLSYMDAAEREIRAALALRQRVLGEEHPDTLGALNQLAGVLCARGQFAEGERLARRVLQAQRRLGHDDVQKMWTMSNLAWALSRQGKATEADSLAEEALSIARRQLGDTDAQTLHLRYARAGTLQALGRLDKAVKEYRAVLVAQRRLLGKEHPACLQTMRELSSALLARGDIGEAEEVNREVLAMSRAVHGDDHPRTIEVMKQRAWLLRSTGRPADAAVIQREVLSWHQRHLGEDHDNTIGQLFEMALNLTGGQKWADAEPLLRKVVAAGRKKHPPEDPRIMGPLAILGVALFFLNRHPEAEKALREAITAAEKGKQPITDPYFPCHKATLGGCLLAQKKYAEAEPFLVAAIDALKTDQARRPAEYRPGTFWHGVLTQSLGCLVEVYEATGKKDEAAKRRKEREASKAAAKKPV